MIFYKVEDGDEFMETKEKVKVASVVNADGEIVTDLYEGDTYKRISAEQKDYMKSYTKNFKGGESFVKLYDEIVPKLIKELTPGEITFVLSLVNHVSYEDCVIRKTNNASSDILDSNELAKILNIAPSTVRKYLSTLKTKGIIGVHEVGSILPKYYGKKQKVITVNPNIYFRGININKTVETFYENSGW